MHDMLLQGCNAWALMSDSRAFTLHVGTLEKMDFTWHCSLQEVDKVRQGASGQPGWMVTQDAASWTAIHKLGNLLRHVRPLCVD